jgi:AbiTii
MALLEDIRTHVLDNKYPLAAILREAMVLAHKLKSKELATWVTSELEGFRDDAELPSYRKYRAMSVGTGSNRAVRGTNVHIPTYMLPDDMRRVVEEGKLTISVQELEALLETETPSYYTPWPDTIISHFNYMSEVNFSLVAASIVITRGLIEHVLGAIRTRLLKFVLEIEELNPDAGEIPSLTKIPQTVVHQLFENVIMNNEHHGDLHNIVGAQGSNIATGNARISSSHASYANTADATAAFEALKTHLSMWLRRIDNKWQKLSICSPRRSTTAQFQRAESWRRRKSSPMHRTG